LADASSSTPSTLFLHISNIFSGQPVFNTSEVRTFVCTELSGNTAGRLDHGIALDGVYAIRGHHGAAAAACQPA
jgi:hypothetical protein